MGLTAYGGGALTELQPPYCPIPERVEQVPLWGFRWPGIFVPLIAYRAVQTWEYRLPGAGTYEVEVQERVAFFDNADGLPVGTQTGLADGVSPGVLRLRVTSGGHAGVRTFNPRDTYVVTGEYLRIEILLPTTAVLLALQALPAPAVGEGTNVVVGDASVRVTAVPARSRNPTPWVVQDWVTVPPEGTSIVVPVYPGASEVRVEDDPVGPSSLELLSSPLALAPSVLVGPGSLPFAWHQLQGASAVRLIGGEQAGIQVLQRGWV